MTLVLAFTGKTLCSKMGVRRAYHGIRRCVPVYERTTDPTRHTHKSPNERLHDSAGRSQRRDDMTRVEDSIQLLALKAHMTLLLVLFPRVGLIS